LYEERAMSKGNKPENRVYTMKALIELFPQEHVSWRKAKERVRMIAYHPFEKVLRQQPNWNKYYECRRFYMEDAWHDGAKGFLQFLLDVGPIPDEIWSQTDMPSLDRIDGTNGYVRGNVRWATPKMQQLNRACTTQIRHDATGEIMSQAEASYRMFGHKARLGHLKVRKGAETMIEVCKDHGYSVMRFGE
jgi:hypothetical protein